MNEITDEMIQLTDEEGNNGVFIYTGNTDRSSTSKDTRTGYEKAMEVKSRILQNEILRKKVVDLADIWDGRESERYGKSLLELLHSIGIHDMPDFYKKENINKLIDELVKERRIEKRLS